MDKREITEQAVRQLVENKALQSSDYEIVSDANNLVSKVDGGYLKIYTPGNSTIQDNEVLLYKITKQPELYKKMLASGTVSADGKPYKYALFETIKGKTLDEIDYSQEDAVQISKTIYNHIQDVGQIQSKGFGDINESFEGSHEKFDSYMFDLQHKTSTTLFNEPLTRKYSALGYNLLVDNHDLLKTDKSSIIPVDLNFKNIMVTDDNRTIIADPGALLAGPKEMAYGEVMAHGYGTKVFDEFKKHLDGTDEYKMRLFAALSLSNVLAFVTKIGLDPTQAKPFGNPNTFFDLIDEHTAFLKKRKLNPNFNTTKNLVQQFQEI